MIDHSSEKDLEDTSTQIAAPEDEDSNQSSESVSQQNTEPGEELIPHAKIAKLIGEVEIKDGTEVRKGTEDSSITSDQTLHTGIESAAALNFGDGAVIVLNESSEVKLTNLVNQSGEPELNLDLISGEIFVLNSDSQRDSGSTGISKTSLPSNFRIKVKYPWLPPTEQVQTSDLIFSGTSAYSVAIDPDSESIHSTCLDGQCSLDQAGNMTNFGNNQVVLVRNVPGQKKYGVTKLRSLNDNDRSIWFSALSFAKTPHSSSPLPIPYPALEQYPESDPAPFPFTLHEQTATVLKTTGDVTINNANHHLSVAEKLFSGDVLHTDPGAGVVLQLDNGIVIILNEQSTVHLSELSESTEGGETNVFLEKGELYALNLEPTPVETQFTVDIPGELSVRRMRFINYFPRPSPLNALNISYEPQTGEFYASVVDGEIEISHGAEKFELFAGEIANGISSGGKISKGEAVGELAASTDTGWWLGALDFAGVDPSLFSALQPFLDSDPAPFPVLVPPGVKIKIVTSPELATPPDGIHTTDETIHHLDLHHIH